MDNANRHRFIQRKLRLTPDEDNHIKQRMAEVGSTTFQNYARKMLLHGAHVNLDFSELVALRLEINRIGHNVNQIAKHVNSSDEVTNADMEELRQLLHEISDQVTVGLRDVKRIEKAEAEAGWEKFKGMEDLINQWL